MELQRLASVLRSAVAPEKEERRAAEEELNKFKFAAGHLTSLLQCIVATQLDTPVRQAAAIHFKNLCSREWDPEEEEAGAPPQPRLPEADKAVVRANMLEAVVQSPPLIRAQLGVALRSQLEADFPERWPELLPGILGALGSPEKERVHGGLFALRFLCRKYEYKNEAARAMLHGVVQQVGPALLQLTQGLLALGSLQLEVAELLKLVLKTLWSCLYMDIPPTLQPVEAFHPWMLVLGALVELPLPVEAQPAERDDREAWAWWKAKKWAFRICNRLFSRYSVPKQSRDPAHRAFAERFKTSYSCQVMSAYIRVLSALPAGGYLPDRVVNYALQLLEHAVPKAAPYRLMQPELPNLVFRVAFPLLCFSAEDAELWEEDPHEYIRKGYDIIEDMYSPRTAAMSFVTELLRVRGGDQLHPFLTFLSSILQRCAPGVPEDTRPHAELDGALYALGSLSDLLRKREPYTRQLEAMLIAHVLPEFRSTRGHLRAKACWVAGMYADVEFAERRNFELLLVSIISSLNDRELPVRVDAVIALRYFVDAAEDITGLRTILPGLLNELFKLMAEVENEDLVFTLEALVEKFGEEMAPYADGLVQNLVAAFWRSLDTQDGGSGDEEGAGALACLGSLRTVATVLDAISGKPALYPALELQLLPVLQRMLSLEGQDVYEELLDILSYITYYSPTISDAVWALFPVLIENVREWGLEYFSESLTALDNLISRDTERFLTGWDARGVRHLDAVLSLVGHVLSEGEFEDADCVCAPQLLAIVLQHCRGRVDALLEPILRLVAARLEGDRSATDPFLRDVLLLVWANAIYYNPQAALAAAVRSSTLAPLFRAWNAALGKRRRGSDKRVHFRREQDKKLCAVALTHLLLLPPGEAPPEVEATHGLILSAALQLLAELKAQREQRVRQEEEGEEEEEDESSESGGGLEEEEEPSGALGGGLVSHQQRVEEDEGDDDDSEWSDFTEEEDGASGPLDAVEPFVFFADALGHLQATLPQRFALITQPLDVGQQAVLQGLGKHAIALRQKAAAEAAAAAVAGH